MNVIISKTTTLAFIIGLIFGLSVSLLKIELQVPNYKPQSSFFYKSERGSSSLTNGHAHSHRNLQDVDGPEEILVFHKKNESVHRDEQLVARTLSEKVRVLCWIMTQPDNHKSKVRYKFKFYLCFEI